MVLRKLIIALLMAGYAQVATAQMHGGGPGVVFRPSFGFAGRHWGFDRAFFYGDPYLLADYPPESWDSPPQYPPIVLVQPAPSAEPPAETHADPLLIELQGDRYVRISGASSQRQAGFGNYAEAGTPKPSASAARAAAGERVAALPPAVLIYRDGHSEQVTDYAIVAGVIYARGDYWQSGYWTKPIQLSALNLPATIQANQEQGVKFVLPSGPNEVVTRP